MGRATLRIGCSVSRRAADPPPSLQEVVGVSICVEDGYESDHDPYLSFFLEITSVLLRSAHMKSI